MSKKLEKLKEVNDNIKKILVEMETRLFLENNCVVEDKKIKELELNFIVSTKQ